VVSFPQAVGISQRRLNDLRDTFITRAAEAGVPIAVVQAQVGHLSQAMTAYYTHICEGVQFEAAVRMERQAPELLACLGLARRDVKSEDGSAGRNP
jgi:integrase